MNSKNPKILITGSTGYIGGRLLRVLEQNGYKCRCLLRPQSTLAKRCDPKTKVVCGDLLNFQTMENVFDDIDVAFYLVHSMGSKADFVKQDQLAAKNFAVAAGNAGLKRIIYLGGLGCDEKGLSDHLQSRHDVGKILRSTQVQVIEFRASVIIGSGSLSYELVRALVERLPVMVTPRWVTVDAQPISINDVLDYLIAAIHLGLKENHIFEIGGRDVISYEGIMREYAKQRGLRPIMIHVPVLTPYLSSLWLGLVTPVYARIGRKLIDSIRYPTVVTNGNALKEFKVKPRGIQQSLAEALLNEDKEFAETRWSDSLSSSGNCRDWGGIRFGNRMVDSRTENVAATPEMAFMPIRQIGGLNGWYYANWLWILRGFLDLAVGGIGIRRGRRDPNWLRVGDTLDCWRVEAYEPNRLLRLFAEMKLPGRAWLEFEVSQENMQTIIRQTAIFDPIGLWGNLYWFAVYPLHSLIFSGMLRSIAKRTLPNCWTPEENLNG